MAAQIDSTANHSFQGKLVLITGCTGGIGRATALALARHGCLIAVHYNSAASTAASLVDTLNAGHASPRAKAFQADLSTYEATRALHKAVVEQMGHIDILFSNHGITGLTIGRHGEVGDVDIEEFERVWRVNSGTSYLLAQLCIPHMETQQWGRVIFCSSVAANTGGVIGPHYASSKSALHGTMHWLAARYAKSGITCNAVAPALITDTNMMANHSKPEEITNLIPVGRFGRPEEIASVVEMLAGNGYMTNKVIVADGGWTGTGF